MSKLLKVLSVCRHFGGDLNKLAVGHEHVRARHRIEETAGKEGVGDGVV